MLWEALAGEHPFWRASVLEMRAGDRGRRPAARVRPPRPAEAAARGRRPGARARPAAPAAAGEARAALRRATVARAAPARRPGSARRPVLPRAVVPGGPPQPASPRSPPAGRARAALLPRGWPPGLAALAARATVSAAARGLALALAVPLFPLGNLSLGLALVYAVVAAAWLALFARDPAAGLLPALGPLLAPLARARPGPARRARLRSPVRRAAAAVAALLVAARRRPPGRAAPAHRRRAAARRSDSRAARTPAPSPSALDAVAARPALLLGRSFSRPRPCSSRTPRARGPLVDRRSGAALPRRAPAARAGVAAAPIVIAVLGHGRRASDRRRARRIRLGRGG